MSFSLDSGVLIKVFNDILINKKPRKNLLDPSAAYNTVSPDIDQRAVLEFNNYFNKMSFSLLLLFFLFSYCVFIM